MKILASDYDGTIKVDEVVSQKTKKAISKWQAEGNWFGIVTGRSTTTIKKEIEEMNFTPDFVICNNGGVILNKDLELLQLYLINTPVAVRIIEEVKNGLCTEVIVNDGFHRARQSMGEKEGSLHGGVSTCSLEEMLQQGKVAQIVLGVSKQEEAIDLAKHLNHQYGDSVEAFANLNCVDVVPKGCSKVNGVLWVANEYNLSVESIYAIGDSYNDLSMLEAFSSATFHHAVQEIKDRADQVVEDIGDFLAQI